MKYRLILLATLLAASLSAKALTLLTEDWPPVSFANDKGQPAGMAVEVVQTAARPRPRQQPHPDTTLGTRLQQPA